ncbi:MAG: DNA mismatch repair endonuclease MutL [Elusimicrobia bacterium]|nr:DNA mismatch repair endonuclease MutL [Elusimicrobiota bacterium]
MATRVRLLEDHLVQQIAAGEVVERPASVVKEILENALDASSRAVSLEIVGSGKEAIRISDDGCGIHSEDVLLAIQRHSTSKITSFEDLQTLTSFGFRGEALPSIAAVSKLELTTRSESEPYGTSIQVHGGNVVSQKQCGRSQGTTIEVRDLFFNTPARLKFLKSDGTERSRILRAWEETLMAHPSVSFSFKSESKTISYPNRKNCLDRVRDVWGEQCSEENLVPLSFRHPSLSITGWISKPSFHQSAKSYQLIYINKRPILSRSLTHALYESYRDCLPVGRHPAAVLFLDVNPSEVDFNVHPSKREVRFRNESQIYDALIREIRSKRTSESSAPKVFVDAPILTQDHLRQNFDSPVMPDSTVFSSSFPRSAFISEKTLRSETLVRQPVKILSQFHSLYILAEEEGNLLIVDQHAAAERVLYEQFKQNIQNNRELPTQKLLIPMIWNVSLAQAELLQNHRPAFLKLGFQIEPFGETTFRVLESPAAVPETEIKNVLEEILSSLENQNQPTLAIEEKIMHAACRAAIKANDQLTHQELGQLLEELKSCQNPHTCPHGRPTTLTISRQELDKKFGRV